MMFSEMETSPRWCMIMPLVAPVVPVVYSIMGAFIGTRHGKFHWGKFVLFFRQPAEADKGKAGDGAVGDYDRSAGLFCDFRHPLFVDGFLDGDGQGAMYCRAENAVR